MTQKPHTVSLLTVFKLLMSLFCTTVLLPATSGEASGPAGPHPVKRSWRAVREVCDGAKVTGQQWGEDGGWRATVAAQRAWYANELCHLPPGRGWNFALEGSNSVQGAAEGEPKSNSQERAGRWRTPTKASFSVSINELISRILKVGAGANLISPKNSQPCQQSISSPFSWKKQAERMREGRPSVI